MNIEKTLQRFFWPVLLLMIFLTVAFSVHLSRISPFEDRKLLFVPEPEYVERISGTFRNPVALMFYMKGAQELAYNHAKKFDLLLALFDLTISLDPKIIQAAFLGGMVAPARYSQLPRAIELLKKSYQSNPQNWSLPYWIGFNYLQLEEYEKAAAFYNEAAALPGALPFLKTSSVHILSRGSRLELAISEAERLLLESHDEDTTDLMLLRLKWLKIMQMLEDSNREFKQKVGRFPQRLEELVEHGILKELPPDEFGEGFYLVNPGDPEEGYRVRSDY